MSAPQPPGDGHLFPASLHVRQHEVQVVAGPGGRLAAAWADDLEMRGMDGWTSGYSVSLDRGQSWSPPLFRKHPDLAVTANPAIAMNRSGAAFAVSMSVEEDYTRGVLEFSSSIDLGRSWTPWRTDRIEARRDPRPTQNDIGLGWQSSPGLLECRAYRPELESPP